VCEETLLVIVVDVVVVMCVCVLERERERDYWRLKETIKLVFTEK
jgi:hypothetical protein